jgi:hypothetical protein
MRRGSFIAGLFALALVLGAWTPGSLDTTTPQYGRLAAASVTGTTAGTANTIITLSGRRRIVACTNSLDTETILTYNAANWLFLPAGSSVVMDLSASGLTFADAKVVGVYYLTVPTTGSIACTAH